MIKRILCAMLTISAAFAQGRYQLVPFPWTEAVAPPSGNHLLPNLLAFWKADEASGNLIDSSGSGNTLTVNGTPGSGTGVVAGSRTFDNTSPDYFTEAFNSAFGFGGGSATIAGWAQFDTTITSDMTIIARGDFGGGINFSWALL